jgi:YggT family protein
MKSILILLDNIIHLYLWVVIISAVLSWLTAFNVINTSNRFVYSVIQTCYRLTEPALEQIRRFLPVMGGMDFSPVVLILLLMFLRNLLFELFAPGLF